MAYRDMHFLQPGGPWDAICYVLEMTAHHGRVGSGNRRCKGVFIMSPRTLRSTSTFIRSMTDAATVRPFLHALLALKRARVAGEAPPSPVAAPDPRAMPVAA